MYTLLTQFAEDISHYVTNIMQACEKFRLEEVEDREVLSLIGLVFACDDKQQWRMEGELVKYYNKYKSGRDVKDMSRFCDLLFTYTNPLTRKSAYHNLREKVSYPGVVNLMDAIDKFNTYYMDYISDERTVELHERQKEIDRMKSKLSKAEAKIENLEIKIQELQGIIWKNTGGEKQSGDVGPNKARLEELLDALISYR